MFIHNVVFYCYKIHLKVFSFIKLILFQQLTKVGLPMSVMSGMNPLSNGIINPAGKFAHQ